MTRTVALACVITVIAVGSVVTVDRGGAGPGRDAVDVASHDASGAVVPRDLNGDGFSDLLVPGPAVEHRGDEITRSAVVVLGTSRPVTVDTASPPPGAVFKLRTRYELSLEDWVGDIDGDGLSDVVLSTSGRRRGSNARLLFFGRRDLDDVNLDAQSPNVMRIPGSDLDIAPAGDVNGDGLGDLIFDTYSGRLTVVYGRKDRSAIRRADLRHPGRRGYVVTVSRRAGHRVNWAGPAGDLTGDGIDDLGAVLEIPRCGDVSGFGCGGRLLTIFGRPRPQTVRVAGDPGVMRGRRNAPLGYLADTVLGYAEHGPIGDFDGDGLDDFLGIGWEYGQGTLIIHGRRSVRPPRLSQTIRIRDRSAWGAGNAPVGDINGDGLGDVVIADDKQGHLSVILGRRARTPIDPRRSTAHTLRILLPAPMQASVTDASAALRTAPAGDVDGDGLRDFTVAAVEEAGYGADVTYLVLSDRLRNTPGSPMHLEDVATTIK